MAGPYPQTLVPPHLSNGCVTPQAERLVVSGFVAQLPGGVTNEGNGGVSFNGGWGLNSLLVSTGGSGLTSTVAPGAAYIAGNDQGGQGTYEAVLTAAATITHDATDPSNPRRDIVIARIVDSQFAGGSANQWQLEIVKGTPATSPVDPTIPGNDFVRLARVLIPANTTGPIPAANYTDLRVPYQSANPAYITATSTTLPANPQPGTIVWETDNKAFVYWNGTAWVGLTTGSILASKVYAPGSGITVGGTTYAVLDSTNLAITCVIPPSGKVRLKFNALVNLGASSNVALAWSTQNTSNANFASGALAFYDNNAGGTTQMGYETTASGLTPGSTVTFYLQGCVPSGANTALLISAVPVAGGPAAGFYLEAAAA